MIGAIADFSALKDFIDYGLNKTLINLKIRRLADVKVREILQGAEPKKPTDWLKFLMVIVVVVIIGLVLYQMITQMVDVSGKDQLISQLYAQLGQCKGQLGQNVTIIERPPGLIG